MKKKLIKLFILIVAIIVILPLTYFGYHVARITWEDMERKKSPCYGQQWANTDEYMACYFPDPPIGRWHAVYSKDFALAYNLPLENVSKDLSPGIDYMEMDVQPFNQGKGVMCIANMLVKKPHDMAFYNLGGRTFKWDEPFHEQRKLLHLIDIEKFKPKIKRTTTMGGGFRHAKYKKGRGANIGNNNGFYAEDVLPGYDYISTGNSCYWILSSKRDFPDGHEFNIAKASVWGRYENRYGFSGNGDTGRPKGKEFFDSRLRINLPKEIVQEIFYDMPIGGR